MDKHQQRRCAVGIPYCRDGRQFNGCDSHIAGCVGIRNQYKQAESRSDHPDDGSRDPPAAAELGGMVGFNHDSAQEKALTVTESLYEIVQ